MPKPPTFSYMGGKARIREWLVDHFPKEGNRYLEPFAGAGNVFYHARTALTFKHWYLGDINVSLLHALTEADFEELPEGPITKEDFTYWKNAATSISYLLEPYISFGGKGYKAGFRGEKYRTRYNKVRCRAVYEAARQLLKGCCIEDLPWNAWHYNELGWNDFVYFDPPYLGTKASYPNIDHNMLIELLNNADFKWAISGYDRELYNENLKFANRYTKTRNSELKMSNTSKAEPVQEILWTNYLSR